MMAMPQGARGAYATLTAHEETRVVRIACIGPAAIVAALVALLAAPHLAAQQPPPPHPDFTGIWQGMKTAAGNIQDHQASKDGPAGVSVVDGNDIPYQPWALAKKRENFENRATADPESKCY